LPLHLWLPGTYSETSAPAAALFAILTKVGVYALVRSGTVVFPEGVLPLAGPATAWLVPAALATAAIGYLGMLAARGLRELAAFAVLGSTGTLLAAAVTFEPAGVAAALVYLPHSVLSTAALFLLADLLARRRAGQADALAAGPAFASERGLGAMFFVAAVAATGLPPLAGFVGKLLVLEALRGEPGWPWLWAAILGATLIGVLALARAGSVLFWNRQPSAAGGPAAAARPLTAEAAPLAGALIALAGLAVFAGPLDAAARATAAQLADPTAYIAAVLGP
jgi:multicomponent K+:H+ antiporter subunit D